MSARRYREIQKAVDAITKPLLADVRLAILQRITEADEGAISAIQKVQPAHIDLSQELADEITRKLRGPLVIPQEMSDWLREEAKFRDMISISRIGYSASAADAEWTLRSDGSLKLEIRRQDGMRWWIGVFGPPDKS